MKRTRDPTQDVGRSVPVDMTSLVDVTFQLLVFLLVVNDLSAKQMEDVELPDAQNATEIRPDDAAFVEKMRSRDIGRPTIVGNADQVREIALAYRDAGVDELIVPDFTLGPMDQKKATLDTFIEKVAAPLR